MEEFVARVFKRASSDGYVVTAMTSASGSFTVDYLGLEQAI